MSDPISSVRQPSTPIQTPATKGDDASAKPESRPVPTDTVELSSATKTALKEVLETPAQTAKEAAGGDLQAKKLLAKELAKAELDKPEAPSSVHVVA